MKVEVTYREADVESIIMAAHVAEFGDAPKGTKWVISTGSYSWSGYKVESEKIEDAQPEVEVANV